MKKFPFYNQLDHMDCGPTCLKMIIKYYGKNYSLHKLRTLCEISKDGVNFLGISQAAEAIGFRTLAIKASIEKIKKAPLPCIIHWSQNHFVVLYKIKNSRFYVADPSKDLLDYSENEFLKFWTAYSDERGQRGLALLLEPKNIFFSEADSLDEDNTNKKSGELGILRYILKYKVLLFQLVLSLFAGSLLQLLLPFLSQSVVDIGIKTENIDFINLVLIAQMMFFLGRISIYIIRSWIVLHISTRVNLSILSDFLIKLLKLPLSFFEGKQTGDILQRIGDHSRIENFLSVTAVNTIFSLFNLVLFTILLSYYRFSIFLFFLFSTIVYFLWILFFLKKRKRLDYKRFSISSKIQTSLIQLVESIPELKLNNATIRKRWDWENLQIQDFKLNIKTLALQQYQQIGALFINEGKNIYITFLSANAVVSGHLSLGEMMAIQYIIGQLNGPIEQLVAFIQQLQDTKIAIERMGEIYRIEDEETHSENSHFQLNPSGDISLKNISYRYPGAGNPEVLKNVSFDIPYGKITAVVGGSGSGKTTILKIILKFMEQTKGEIMIGKANIKNLNHSYWRSLCGTVFQDGYIFSDSIAGNICVSDEQINTEKLLNAVTVSNIREFIEELPLNYNTKIGNDGNGLSQGQKQRILIARAVYKNPEYIFFDEATSSLDAENERIIMENLSSFFKNRTVLIVAHRLSTVKNADQIIVLEKGEVVEIGTHNSLCLKKGRYYQLVKNQLELGN